MAKKRTASTDPNRVFKKTARKINRSKLVQIVGAGVGAGGLLRGVTGKPLTGLAMYWGGILTFVAGHMRERSLVCRLIDNPETAAKVTPFIRHEEIRTFVEFLGKAQFNESERDAFKAVLKHEATPMQSNMYSRALEREKARILEKEHSQRKE
ncbi:MAG: hypothetical protein V1847_00305 [Candidatus Diapherotrites archaeon]